MPKKNAKPRTLNDDDRELVRYRVLVILRKYQGNSSQLRTGWLKRSELSEGVMRHMSASDRDLVLYAMVRDGIIMEAMRRRAHGPGAPARMYRLNTLGRKELATLAKKYRRGSYQTTRGR